MLKIGKGYSTLSNVNSFDFEYFRFKKSFIDGINISYSDIHLPEAIMAVAHKLGLKVIAEGVEKKEQEMILKKLDVTFLRVIYIPGHYV